ncbi:nad-dependent protein deacetylase sirtuin-7 [Anaeramoeba flamelloides]|uniref:protein acetyllysine N-acetyltransferase n=1 Tax=Anaeramoeba flamelloides TaxID=1746091 RepID=A0AAV7YJP1_9EUKA|nr:nad-dependent protein deacetylase sirtuin-7 [Anaeramoeba flamelloides]KAJ6244349.1 nad-dependent protein deacetylase sirtuin-7 [Anaeramoeba flamelloides]
MSEEDKKEYKENLKSIKKKAAKLAKLIRKSKYVVIHTGAGISTSAGIPDYRGPNGLWTCLDQNRETPVVDKPWNLLEPTNCHMTIATLLQRGLVKHLVSQNTDGLHLHSGVPLEKISELHGNSNKEYCKDCQSEYFRPFRCRTSREVHDHQTGRKCDKCGGKLYDSIINFGENLSEKQINSAYLHSKKADLSIVLGTSLRVTPAADLPMINVKKQKGKMVIVNLQKTPLDDYASIRVFGRTDQFCFYLMRELEIPVPTFKQALELRAKKRREKLQLTEKEEKKQKIQEYKFFQQTPKSLFLLDYYEEEIHKKTKK